MRVPWQDIGNGCATTFAPPNLRAARGITGIPVKSTARFVLAPNAEPGEVDHGSGETTRSMRQPEKTPPEKTPPEKTPNAIRNRKLVNYSG